VPLAPPEIAGVLNVRGRILTIIDMRRRLELEALEESRRTLVVGIEHKGESYGLLIDRVGEVLKLPARSFEDNPINFDRTLAQVSAGVHRLDGIHGGARSRSRARARHRRKSSVNLNRHCMWAGVKRG
jgi:purine-binding chemotaxis protein CheW